MDHSPADRPFAADVEQQHVRLLLQEVLLRGVHDVPGPDVHPPVRAEERRQGRGKHEVKVVVIVCIFAIINNRRDDEGR